MTRFYFNLCSDETVVDPFGAELPNLAAAIEFAEETARRMAADSVACGRLVLHHHVNIATESGEVVGVVEFGDVLEVQD